MHQQGTTCAVQLWRLSDLELLKTIELPNGPRGVEGTESGEPRLLSDGKTVLVATYRCSLFRLSALDTVARLIFGRVATDSIPPLAGSDPRHVIYDSGRASANDTALRPWRNTSSRLSHSPMRFNAARLSCLFAPLPAIPGE